MTVQKSQDLWGELRSLLWSPTLNDQSLVHLLSILLQVQKRDLEQIWLPYAQKHAPQLDWEVIDWFISAKKNLICYTDEIVYPETIDENAVNVFLCGLCWLSLQQTPIERNTCVVRISNEHLMTYCMNIYDPCLDDNFTTVFSDELQVGLIVWRDFFDSDVDAFISTPDEQWLKIVRQKPKHPAKHAQSRHKQNQPVEQLELSLQAQ